MSLLFAFDLRIFENIDEIRFI